MATKRSSQSKKNFLQSLISDLKNMFGGTRRKHNSTKPAHRARYNKRSRRNSARS